MPFASVTRMIVSPLRALRGLPLTSTLTNSSAMLCRPRSKLFLDDAAAAVIDHVLELVPEMLEEALHRPGRRIAERTDGVALDAVGDIDEERELLAPRLAREHALQQSIHPARSLAARRALAAGLRHVEARDALEHPHHAGGLVHDDDRRGPDGGADGTQRVVVEVGLEHHIPGHHGYRGAARDHRLQAPAT